MSLTEIFRQLHWEYPKAGMAFILKRTANRGYAEHLSLTWFQSAFRQKPDILLLLRKIRQLFSEGIPREKQGCAVCGDTGTVRVYNYRYDFHPGFNKRMLLEMAYTNCAVDIPCPHCSDPSVYERYMKGIEDMSDLDRQISDFYQRTFCPELQSPTTDVSQAFFYVKNVLCHR